MTWKTGMPPFTSNVEFRVQIGEKRIIRTCKRIPNLDFGNLFFTDTNHPAANIYCDRTQIKAWELTTQPNNEAKAESK